jgi:hypothetical protein
MLFVRHYLTSYPYLVCQTDSVHEFLDSPVLYKLTLFHLVNHFCGTGSVNDKCSGWFSVLSDDFVENLCECYNLHESLWENLLSKVDGHTEVFVRQRRFWSFILTICMPSRNWRNLVKGKDFSVVSQYSVDSLPKFVLQLRFGDISEYVNSQSSWVWSVENPTFSMSSCYTL